jgi:hypothetical protein
VAVDLRPAFEGEETMILAILATVTVLSIMMGALMSTFAPDHPSDTWISAFATLYVTAVVSGAAIIITAIWKFLV